MWRTWCLTDDTERKGQGSLLVPSSQREGESGFGRYIHKSSVSCICSNISLQSVLLIKVEKSQCFLGWSFLCFYSKNLQRIFQHDYYRFYFSERCHWLFSFSSLSVCLTGCADRPFYEALSAAVSHAHCKQTRSTNIHTDTTCWPEEGVGDSVDTQRGAKSENQTVAGGAFVFQRLLL